MRWLSDKSQDVAGIIYKPFDQEQLRQVLYKCDRGAVKATQIYKQPKEDYTKKLLAAIPKGVPKELLSTSI